jgi:hypothetical protein
VIDRLRTEAEIVDLFAASNPIPNEPAGGPITGRWLDGDRPDDTKRSSTMIELEERHDADVTSRWRHTRNWVAAAAAIAIAVIAGVVVVTSDDDAPAAPTPTTAIPTTTTDPVPADGAARIGVAEDFIAAFNARDVDTLRELAATNQGRLEDFTNSDAPSLFAWYDMFEWRWEDVTCDATDAGASCAMTRRNRLGDFTGIDVPARVHLTIVDGRIEDLVLVEDFNEYAITAFEPFVEWVTANHPGDLGSMWPPDDAGGRTAAGVELFDANLAEYTAPGRPEPRHRAFLRSQSDGDTDAMLATLAPAATVDQLWAVDAAEIVDLARLLHAVDWEWNVDQCREKSTDAETTGPVLRCTVRPTAAWSTAGIDLASGDIAFEFTTDGIASVTSADLAHRIGDDLEPFWEWLRTQHPGDAAVLLTERNGTTMPVLEPGAIARFDVLVDEYVRTAGA